MSAGTRPPLLKLGGQEAFKAYEKEFGGMYQNRRLYDVLGNQVIFDITVCRHICTKTEENTRSRVWVQERAEYIPWILTALTDPGTEIRPDKDLANRWNYLLVVEADPTQGLVQEYYCVVAEKLSQGLLTLVTAFPIDYRSWAMRRKSGKAFYPIKRKDGAQCLVLFVQCAVATRLVAIICNGFLRFPARSSSNFLEPRLSDCS